jgi:hypothetical protein
MTSDAKKPFDPSNFLNLEATCTEVDEMSPEEQARLLAISSNPCPLCKGTMLVGDDEYLGVCGECCLEDNIKNG